jgi:hypothetical protein
MPYESVKATSDDPIDEELIFISEKKMSDI